MGAALRAKAEERRTAVIAEESHIIKFDMALVTAPDTNTGLK